MNDDEKRPAQLRINPKLRGHAGTAKVSEWLGSGQEPERQPLRVHVSLVFEFSCSTAQEALDGLEGVGDERDADMGKELHRELRERLEQMAAKERD